MINFIFWFYLLGASRHEKDPRFNIEAGSEFNYLNKIGIKAEPLSRRKKCFLDAQSEHWTYNIKDYSVDGLSFGTELDSDRYCGKVVWMGRHYDTKPKSRDEIFIGLELVSIIKWWALVPLQKLQMAQSRLDKHHTTTSIAIKQQNPLTYNTTNLAKCLNIILPFNC